MCISVFIQSIRYCCQILMKLEFSGHIFEKCPSINFLENPPSVSRVVPCGQTDGRTDGQTDGQTDMTKLVVFFSQFCERAQTAEL